MAKLNQLVLVTTLLAFGSACSDIGFEKQSLAVRAQEAKIIVYAQAVRQYPLYGSGGLYTTEFELICTLKCKHEYTNEESDKKQLFNVTEMGFASGKCLEIATQVGQAYFMFIQPQVEDGIGSNAENTGPLFVPDPINSENPVLPDTEETRASLEEYIYDSECVITKEPEIEKEEGSEGEYEGWHPDEWGPLPEEEDFMEEENKNNEEKDANNEEKDADEENKSSENIEEEFENSKDDKELPVVKSTETTTTIAAPIVTKRTEKTIVSDEGKLAGPPKKIGLARAMRLIAPSTGSESVNATVLPITTTSSGNKISVIHNLALFLLLLVSCCFM